ncbi:MAG TPA: BON domain-containing protein [Pyrinomonadaceae bacterium]|nr:BON domain-containing protein [Pyrinomonadaceae bacterium]
MKLKVLGLTALLALTAGLIAACGGAATNTSNANHSNTVTNLGANNANTGAVVVNANSNMNTNSNRWNSNITREEYEKNKGEYEKEKGSSTIGTGANDMWLWVKTRASLMGASDLRDSTINVDVVNDVVTLKGSVATAAQKTKAEQVAKEIDGVKSVKNELKVAPNDSMTNMSSSNSNTHGNTNTNKK